MWSLGPTTSLRPGIRGSPAPWFLLRVARSPSTRCDPLRSRRPTPALPRLLTRWLKQSASMMAPGHPIGPGCKPKRSLGRQAPCPCLKKGPHLTSAHPRIKERLQAGKSNTPESPGRPTAGPPEQGAFARPLGLALPGRVRRPGHPWGKKKGAQCSKASQFPIPCEDGKRV